MRLEVRHFEVLLAIDRAGSLSRAAQALDYDQPHVSRLLQRIESRLGYAVFERGAHGSRPTAAGRDVLDRAREALAAIDRLQRRDPASARPDLRLLCHDVDPGALVDRLLRARPGLDVALSTTELHAASEELAAGHADVLVAAQLPHTTWERPPSVTGVEVLSAPAVVVVSRRHRLAGATAVELRDLAGENWVTGTDPQQARALVEQCRSVGGFEPRIRYRTTAGTVDGLVARGLGVRLGSPAGGARPGCVALPYAGAGAVRLVVEYVRGAVDRSLAAAIVALVRDLAVDAVPAGADRSPEPALAAGS